MEGLQVPSICCIIFGVVRGLIGFRSWVERKDRIYTMWISKKGNMWNRVQRMKSNKVIGAFIILLLYFILYKNDNSIN